MTDSVVGNAAKETGVLAEYRWDVFLAHDIHTWVPLAQTFQLFNRIPRADFPDSLQFGVKILVDTRFRVGDGGYTQLAPATCFLPSTDPDAFDNLSVWSGCGTRVGSNDYLFYTAVSQQELAAAENPGDSRSLGMIPQRIFVARSRDDGLTWQRCSSVPLLDLDTADNAWYERSSQDNAIAGQAQANSACRDPFVFRATAEHNMFGDDASTLEAGKYYMLFTARANAAHAVAGGDIHFRGCIGVASADRVDGPYRLQPPILNLGVFGDLELPHLVRKEGRVFMFFSVQDKCIDGTNSTDCAFANELGVAPDARSSYGYVYDPAQYDWVPMNDRGGHIETPPGVYGVRLFQDPGSPDSYGARGFFLPQNPPRDDGYREFTLTPNMVVEWGQDNHIRISLPE